MYNIYSPECCRFYGSMRGCRNGNNCQFSHNNPYSVPFCRYISSMQGCSYGNNCLFRHHATYSSFTMNYYTQQQISPYQYHTSLNIPLQNVHAPVSKSNDAKLIPIPSKSKSKIRNNKHKWSLSNHISTDLFIWNKYTHLSIFEYSALIYASIIDLNCVCDNNLDYKTSKKISIELMNLCVNISFFITTPNESIYKYYSQKCVVYLYEIINKNILKNEDSISFDIYLINEIISFIESKSNYLKWIKFKDPELQKHVTYSCNDNIIDFQNSTTDYLSIRTKLLNPLLKKGKLMINIYSFNKGDELWLGLVTKKGYIPKYYPRCYSQSLMYYGGREYDIIKAGGLPTDSCTGSTIDCNHGGIQADVVVKHPLNSYGKGDWITIFIDFNKNKECVIFYKNGIKECQIEKTHLQIFLDECYFVLCLDDSVDKFYIEQSIVE